MIFDMKIPLATINLVLKEVFLEIVAVARADGVAIAQYRCVAIG